MVIFEKIHVFNGQECFMHAFVLCQFALRYYCLLMVREESGYFGNPITNILQTDYQQIDLGNVLKMKILEIADNFIIES